jgi:hypothetical protein
MLSTITHGLRTPLNSILTMVNLSQKCNDILELKEN